jgi:hypothetical protein
MQRTNGDFFYKKCVKNSPGAQEVRMIRNPFGCLLFSVVFREKKRRANKRVLNKTKHLSFSWRAGVPPLAN